MGTCLVTTVSRHWTRCRRRPWRRVRLLRPVALATVTSDWTSAPGRSAFPPATSTDSVRPSASSPAPRSTTCCSVVRAVQQKTNVRQSNAQFLCPGHLLSLSVRRSAIGSSSGFEFDLLLVSTEQNLTEPNLT